jgi:hypothetical protein
MGVMDTRPGIDIRDARRGRSFSTKYQHVRIPEMALHLPALGALESPLGWMPWHDDLACNGLGLTPDRFEGLMRLDREAWWRELALHQELDNHLPEEFLLKHESLLARLRRAAGRWASH